MSSYGSASTVIYRFLTVTLRLRIPIVPFICSMNYNLAVTAYGADFQTRSFRKLNRKSKNLILYIFFLLFYKKTRRTYLLHVIRPDPVCIHTYIHYISFYDDIIFNSIFYLYYHSQNYAANWRFNNFLYTLQKHVQFFDL